MKGHKFTHTLLIPLMLITGCSLPATSTPPLQEPTSTNTPAESASPTTSITIPPPTGTNTEVPPTEIPSSTPVPTVESLEARVTAGLLSCRYGPGAEYLYLYALREGANIELIGRTDGNNWVMVKGKNLCWVNAKFLNIAGDANSLKVMYPDGYRVPVSPYYSPPAVLSTARDPQQSSLVTVTWTDITLRAGDEEDENMFIYIIEVWRCEGGEIIFDPLASNYPEVTFVDEPGCSTPSHGRVFFQEKHGYAGPANIPWPAH